jgi:hypothetical protein
MRTLIISQKILDELLLHSNKVCAHYGWSSKQCLYARSIYIRAYDERYENVYGKMMKRRKR